MERTRETPRYYGESPSFPAHHVPLAWVLALLLAPLLVLGIVHEKPLLSALTLTAWLLAGVGVAVAALLDWARVGSRRRGLAGAATHLSRAFIAGLGGLGMAGGIWVLTRTVAGMYLGSIPVATILMGGLFGLMMVVVGAQLVFLAYRRVRRPSCAGRLG